MHPGKKIQLAIQKLERSKAELELRRDELVGYEIEYVQILVDLIAMMKNAANGTHWFQMTGDKTWDTRDRWKRDALHLADRLIEENDDNSGNPGQDS